MPIKYTKQCSMDGCENKNEARSFCAHHYQRLRAYGSAENFSAYDNESDTVKPIAGTNGRYSVSISGEIVRYSPNIRPLKHYRGSTGYACVSLTNEFKGKLVQRHVHRLVAEAFIPNPENKPQVNHKDGDKMNPSANNLEWVTASENGKHSYRELGRVAWHKGNLGADTPTAKKVNRYSMSGEFIDSWDCGSCAVRAGAATDSGSLSRACNGKARQHNGYKWDFA